MKLLYNFFALVCITCMYAQGEFAKNDNGLIYSELAVSKLQRIVDSLNLKFITCNNKDFYAIQQQQAVLISLSGESSVTLKNEIDAGDSYEAIAKRYPDSVFHKNAVAIRNLYKNYSGEDVLVINVLFPDGYDSDLNFSGADVTRGKEFRQGWIYIFSEKTEYSDKNIEAIYLARPFESAKLPERYSRLVQYSECMVDTTATVFLKQDEGVYKTFDEKSYKKISKFEDEIRQKLKVPEYDPPNANKTKRKNNEVLNDSVYLENFDEDYAIAYYKRMAVWDSLRLQRVDSLMSKDKKFKKKFDILYAEVKAGKIIPDEEFEEYIAHFVSAEEALRLKRSRRVIGGCSRDDSPRRHALAIAELAGETTRWEIFLRAHLDIMNDRFERASDGSYAWAQRKTYIKELEVLDINVPDLLMGITLRVENPSQNHYFSNIGRIGRALAEAKDRKTIQAQILSMIKDDSLDAYNRVLMYYLFRNYNYNLEDKQEQLDNNNLLLEAIATMPDFVRPIVKER